MAPPPLVRTVLLPEMSSTTSTMRRGRPVEVVVIAVWVLRSSHVSITPLLPTATTAPAPRPHAPRSATATAAR